MTLKYQAEAVVLAARDAGNTDRLITLFSKEYGKIIAMAYGVRNSKKRQSGALLPFAHLDIFLSKSKNSGLDTAEQWSAKTSFQKLREDLSAMAYASFLGELVNEMWPERETDTKAFDVILKAFYLLQSRNPRIAALASACKLISLAGFRPGFDVCIHCGQDIVADGYFEHLSGGAACRICLGGEERGKEKGGVSELTMPMRKFIFLLGSVFSGEPQHFSVPAKTLGETEELIFNYINHQLDLGRELKSLSFIRQINALV